MPHIREYLASNNDSSKTNLSPFVFVLMWTQVVVTITGNVVTLVAFLRNPAIRRKPSNVYILNLALADAKVGFISLPFYNLWWHNGGIWPFGETVCKLWLVVDYTTVTQSMIAIIFIAWDRLWMVTDINTYIKNQTHKLALVLTIGSWVFWYSFYILLVISWKQIKGDKVDYTHECSMEAISTVGYTWFEVTSQCFIPFVVVVCLNTAVYLTIRERSRRDRNEPINRCVWVGNPNGTKETQNCDINSTKQSEVSSSPLEGNTIESQEVLCPDVIKDIVIENHSIPWSGSLSANGVSDGIPNQLDDESRIEVISKTDLPVCDKDNSTSCRTSCTADVSNRPSQSQDTIEAIVDSKRNWRFTSEARMSLREKSSESVTQHCSNMDYNGETSTNRRGGNDRDSLCCVDSKIPSLCINSQPVSLLEGHINPLFDGDVISNDISAIDNNSVWVSVDDVPFQDCSQTDIGEKRSQKCKPVIQEYRSESVDLIVCTLGTKGQQNRCVLQKGRKAAVTLTILVAVYLTCWTPYHIVLLIETIAGDVVTPLGVFVEYLLWLNSGINPFLYVCTNKLFQGELIKMFRLRRLSGVVSKFKSRLQTMFKQ